jgi:tetratricopeptide (TPR) repeat protein/predicted aspartyl protease
MRLRLAIFLVVVLGLLVPARPVFAGCVVSKIAELPITMRGLRPTIKAKVNGVEGLFFVDTGAFFSFLSPAGAKKFGIPTRLLESDYRVYGVGGRVDVSRATAHTFSIAGLDFHNVDFLVDGGMEDGIDGWVGGNLLAHVDAEYDLGNGVIRLFQPSAACKNTPMAYWATNGAYSVLDIDRVSTTANAIQGKATVNGTRIGVIFDSGAPLSTLTLLAAREAGVTPKTAGVVGTDAAGDGSEWIGPFASFKVGDEEVKNTRLRFGGIRLYGGDMLLGADFFLSHRIFVSNSQRKLYFTYNGGPVFNLESPHPTGQTAAATAPAAAPSPYADAPTDAPGFARRGAAFQARHDFTDTIADLTRAIALDPASEDYKVQRAAARVDDHQTEPAMADLDSALKLKPDDMTALMMRGKLKATAKDLTGARADFAAAAKLADKDTTRRWDLIEADVDAEVWDQAISQLDLWISNNPKERKLAMALNARCWARARSDQNLDQALEDCDEALRKFPGEPAFLDSRALVHLRRGEFNQGIADYQGVLSAQPKNAWALYGRGWARLKKGQKIAGDADIKAAVAIEPKIMEQAKARGLGL